MVKPHLFFLAGLVYPLAAVHAQIIEGSEQRVLVDTRVEERFKNPWPAEWEEQFWNRTNASLRASDVQPGKYGGTFFENEKASYPAAFIGFLKDQQAKAVEFLQRDDDAAWSRKLTMGVDWFPAFTLRGHKTAPTFSSTSRRRGSHCT